MRATVSFPYDIVHLPRHILYLELCQKEVNTRIRMGSAVAWIVAIVATARAGAARRRRRRPATRFSTACPA